MKVELYAIYDTKASYFMTPWPCRNVGIARREFATAVSNKDTALGRYPADYVLYHVGEYNDADGTVASLTPALRICDGVEILQVVEGGVK